MLGQSVFALPTDTEYTPFFSQPLFPSFFSRLRISSCLLAMAALPIDQSDMVSESQLSELAQVLTVGIPENDVLLFADYQMEMMRELCISFARSSRRFQAEQ